MRSVVEEQFTLAAQQAIAELRKEGLLTLDLTAHQVSHTGSGDSLCRLFLR
jgi:hypothetical protein